LSAPLAPQFGSRAQQNLAATFGLWIFLATEVVFFGPLFFGYLYVRTHYPEAAAAASRHTDFALGTANTALLLTSSLCVALAASPGRGRRRASVLLYAAALLGLAFLALKGIEYRNDFAEHLFPGRGFAPGGAGDAPHAHGMQLFFIVYFAMTALHALHLLVGVVLCAAVGLALRRGAVRREHVALAGLYWHFVDVVWIFVYPLLYLVGRAGG
jgi:cytochrome c oxidase subunit 3